MNTWSIVERGILFFVPSLNTSVKPFEILNLPVSRGFSHSQKSLVRLVVWLSNSSMGPTFMYRGECVASVYK